MDQQIQNNFYSLPFFVTKSDDQAKEASEVSLGELEHAARQFIPPSELPDPSDIEGSINLFKKSWNRYVVAGKDLVRDLFNRSDPLLDKPETFLHDVSVNLKDMRSFATKVALNIFNGLSNTDPEQVMLFVRSTLSLDMVQILDLVKEPVVMQTYLRLRDLLNSKQPQLQPESEPESG